MATYTFYPRQPDGSALTFETHEAPGDDSALDKARDILRQHRSSAIVSVWAGDRHIGDVHGGDVRAPAFTGSSA